MISKKLILVILICAAAVLGLGGAGAGAQEPSRTKAITIEPFLQEVILEPTDTSKTFSVQITNNTSSVFNFNVKAVDFGSLNETGGIFFTGSESLKLSSRYGLANWIELDDSVRSLPPGQKIRVDVTLVNRADLAPGGHYGAIFINSVSDSQGGSKPNVSFKQSISALVLAIKRGGERYDMSLASAVTNGSWFREPSKVTLRFKNTGNTHVVPRGTVNLKDSGGEILSRGIINEDSSYVLPGTYRQMPISLHNHKSHFLKLIKSYDLEINYRYDGLDRFAVKTYTVRWLNWPLLIGLILILLALFLAVNYFYGDKIERLIRQKVTKFKKLKR